MSTLPIRRVFLSLRARYHLWSGRRAYSAGRMKSAGRHFQEAIAFGHESFDAYLLLGKIHYRQTNYPRAAIFFERAQSADPARYLLEGFPDDFIASLRDRHQANGRPEYRIVIEAVGHGRKGRRKRSPSTANTAGSSALGDFEDQDEYLRHRGAPPIRPGDGGDIDWDAEARKIFED